MAAVAAAAAVVAIMAAVVATVVVAVAWCGRHVARAARWSDAPWVGAYN